MASSSQDGFAGPISSTQSSAPTRGQTNILTSTLTTASQSILRSVTATASSASGRVSTPASTIHSSSPSGNKFSTGAFVGGIVGAAVGGALLTFILTFFIMSRRRKSHGHRRSSFTTAEKSHRGAATGLDRPSSPPLVDSKYAWELHLPQTVDDMTLQQAMKTLYDRLELHVENFYSDASTSTISNQAIDETKWRSAIQHLETPHLPAPVGTLLNQTRAKTVVMKHCLAYLVVSGIDPSVVNSTFPLLPDEITAVPHAAAKGDKNKPVLTQALARYAHLTSYLLAPISTTLPHYIAHRDDVIVSAVETICTAFAPWALAPATLNVRMDNLSQILREAGDMGIMVAAQPSRFGWRWDVGGRDRDQGKDAKRRVLVMMPAFVKVWGEDGVLIARSKGSEGAEIVGGRIGKI